MWEIVYELVRSGTVVKVNVFSFEFDGSLFDAVAHVNYEADSFIEKIFKSNHPRVVRSRNTIRIVGVIASDYSWHDCNNYGGWY